MNLAQVVLLRGVNVGGHKTFRPAVLARELSHLGAINIGAAGTFVISGRIAAAKLRDEFVRRLPFETEIIICDGREITALAARDVFAGEPEGPDLVRFVSVLAREPRAAPPLPLAFPADGEWQLKIVEHEKRYLFGIYRRQMRAIDYLNRLDRVFGAPLTTRNWNTIGAIARVLERAK